MVSYVTQRKKFNGVNSGYLVNPRQVIPNNCDITGRSTVLLKPKLLILPYRQADLFGSNTPSAQYFLNIDLRVFLPF